MPGAPTPLIVRRPWTLGLLVGLALGGATTAAAQSEDALIGPGLANQLRSMEIRLVSGRIRFQSEYFGVGRVENSVSRGKDRQERLTVNQTTALPTISYGLSTSAFDFTLDVAEGRQLTLHRAPKTGAEPPALEFSQPIEGPVRLSVGAGETRRVHEADTLWHLLLVAGEDCRLHLLPILRALRPALVVPLEEAQLRTQLVRAAKSTQHVDRSHWSTLIAELGSPRYAERQRAERRLRDLGQIVLPYLAGLPRESLDAEQAFRVRAIMSHLERQADEDSAERVAAWMATDPRVWLHLLGDSDATMRTVAREQLAVLLGRPIEFDPQADEATRARQQAAVRALVEAEARGRPTSGPAGAPQR